MERSMDVPMISKKILVISLAGILTISLFAAPTIAEAITGLTGGSIAFSPGNLDKVVFSTAPAKIQKHGADFGGYGVLIPPGEVAGTNMALLVVTSHQGVYDNEDQKPPKYSGLLSPTFSVCSDPRDINSNRCGAEWHTHLADLQVDPTGTCQATNPFGVPLEVARLSFEEPSNKDNVKGKSIVVEGVSLGPQTLTESVSSTQQIFDHGTYGGALVQFDLVPRPGGPVFGLHVCVENVAAINVP